jgi:hypothetical protein
MTKDPAITPREWISKFLLCSALSPTEPMVNAIEDPHGDHAAEYPATAAARTRRPIIAV